jgi:hypothetical protein
MALQDLTPQLRTRLNRMERVVGWFVFLATALLLFGFGYYLYHTAERKGWFKIKAQFFTYVESSAGLNAGDPVYMMGFPVGEITKVEPQKPDEPHNVRVDFEVRDKYFRYIWTGGSYVKVNAAGFLNARELEITRGTNGYEVCVTQPVSVFSLDEARKIATGSPGRWQLAKDVLDGQSNLVFHAYDRVEAVLDDSNAQRLAQCVFESNSIYIYDDRAADRHYIVASWHRRTHRYENFRPDDDTAWLHAVEAPPVSDQLQAMVSQVQAALPGILSLTNKISTVLDNAAEATSNLNTTLVGVRPLVTNFSAISAQLREPGGPLAWALGTNGSDQVQGALTNVNALLVDTDTNLTAMLIHLADLTSNLNAQVQANTNMLGGISKAVTDADDLVQGLKKVWFLRSAFKVKATNAPPAKAVSPGH